MINDDQYLHDLLFPDQESDHRCLFEMLGNPQESINQSQPFQIELQHRIIDLPIFDYPIFDPYHSFGLSNSSRNKSSLNLNSKGRRKKQTRGPQNSIPSNLARELFTRIRNDLEFNKESLNRIEQFITQNKINSQRWAIDAIFMILLFQRDIKGSITHQRFTLIRKNFLKQIFNKKKRTNIENNKKLLQVYIDHVKVYEEEEFDFKNYDPVIYQCKNFFSAILIKKKIQVENYLKVLKQMHEGLREKREFQTDVKCERLED